MAIRVKQIIGDTIELFFNPQDDDLRVGENLWLGETHGQRGIIAQIIEFRTLQAPLLWQELPSLASVHRSSTEPPFSGHEAFRPSHEGNIIQVAIAKIRRRTDPTWRQWDGWIPAQDAVASRTTEQEVLQQCVPISGDPLRLGRTLAGEPFSFDASTLGHVNVIAGGKDTRSMQLAAVMLYELVNHGAPCIVFDSTGEFSHLCHRERHVVSRRESLPPLIHLQAGQNLKIDPRQLGAGPLLTLLTRFGLPRLWAMAYASQPARIVQLLEDLKDAAHQPVFPILDNLTGQNPAFKSAQHAMIHGAFLSCLQAIQGTGLLTSVTSKATALQESYEKMRHGGALLIDISGLPDRACLGAVEACIEMIQGLGDTELQNDSQYPPVVFFEKAHLYLDRSVLGDLMARGRPSGTTIMVLTDMADRLDDFILSQADNLFIVGPMSDEAVLRLGKTGLTDRESLRSLVQRLQDQQALVLGSITKQYPIIFEVGAIDGGERVEVPRRYFRSRRSHDSPSSPPSAKDTTLPLFPDEEPAVVDTFTRSIRQVAAETLPTLGVGMSLAHLTAQWPHLIKRVARRRRILDTILSTTWPVQMMEHTLVVAFPPQHRLQQELFESPEYRGLLEEELSRMFGRAFDVETVLHPAPADPRPRS
jgi:hypothetical protein